MSLPSGFHWGYATASFQIEGSTDSDGRGPTIWDKFSQTPGKIRDGTDAKLACESYAHPLEDIKLMKSYGVTAYRFSISWSRIIPLGGRKDPINAQGVQWYSKLIDELLQAGITPFVTLFHWDIPLALYERYGGMLDTDEFALDFKRYAEVCFDSLGDRVRHWITFNEPVVVAQLGHGTGAFAPGRTSDRTKSTVGDTSTEPWRVIHTQILAHAHAAQSYRTRKQGGQIGITFNADWAEPYSSSNDDTKAAERKLEFFVAVAADPIFGDGDYPESCKAQLGDRLPSFTESEKMLVKGSSDFFGLNHYTTNYIRQDPDLPCGTDFMGNVIQSFTTADGTHIGRTCGLSWVEVVPWGFRSILKWTYERYHYPIYVTENGMCCTDEFQKELPDVLVDVERIDYHRQYLDAMEDAITQDGVDIRSYFAWTLADNWEWADGYSTKFGVTFTEKDEKGRVVKYWPKKSARAITEWFQKRV